MDLWISDWISGFQIGFLDFRVDFWISDWISGFLDFTVDFWISVWISADGVRDFFRDGPLASSIFVRLTVPEICASLDFPCTHVMITECTTLSI